MLTTVYRFLHATKWIFRSIYGSVTPVPRLLADKPRVLAFHSIFPPDPNTASYRCATVARYWSRRCEKYTVVTSANNFASAENFVEYAPMAGFDNIDVIRVDAREVSSRAGFIFPYRLYGPDIPDGALFAWEALRLLRHNPPHIVFASGPLFSDFIAAMAVSSAIDCRLILDYRDEWTINTPPFVKLGWMSKWLERRCLTRAAAVVFVTDGKLDSYRAAFPQLQQRPCFVIPQGWNADIPRRSGMGGAPSASGQYAIAFVGHATSAIPIKSFILALRRVVTRRPDLARCLRFDLLGRCDEDTRAHLSALDDVVAYRVRPPVRHREAVKAIEESYLLLLLNNTDHPGVTPLKFFDYMASDRPILVWGEVGDCARVAKSCGAGIVVPDEDDASLKAAIDQLLATPADHWDTLARKRWREENTTERWVGRMVDCLTNRLIRE